MSKRSIKIAVITACGNGDEGINIIRKIPIPSYISKMKDADKKDAELIEHVKWLEGWINDAITSKERDDERSRYTDSW